MMLIGTRAGRLVVTGLAKRRWSGKRLLDFVRVRCDCGNTNTVRKAYIMQLRTLSCGCIKIENNVKLRRTHGDASRGKITAEYTIWCTMIQRCENPNSQKYPIYGGRGIKVCKRWRHSYANFLQDMGRRPKNHSIERINNNGNYEPKNCRWATAKEQRENQRPYRPRRRST